MIQCFQAGEVMKHSCFSNIGLFFIGLGAIASAAGLGVENRKVYVLDLLEFDSSDEFRCRVDEWKQIKNLKLRVKIRGLSECPVANKNIQEILEELLRSGTEIHLSHVEDKGYFCVLADVYAGKRNIAEGLCSSSPLRTDENDKIAPAVLLDSRKMLTEVSSAVLAEVNNRLQRRLGKSELEKLLSEEADLSDLQEETSFREALERVRTCVQPPLPLIVLWNDLSRFLSVEPDRPIGFEIKGRISLGLALELILSSASLDAQKPVLVEEGGFLLIASPQFVFTRMRPRVYDISELTAIGVLKETDREVGSYSGGSRQ